MVTTPSPHIGSIAVRLQQANIVPVLNAGTAAGLPWYTMPYVRGESLGARMSSGAPLTLTERLTILRDVARALAYAHSEGIVHRDIKPENVLLSHGAAMVTDFGIAKALTASRTQDGVDGTATSATLTQAGGTIGTPAYMAPEQAVCDTVRTSPKPPHRSPEVLPPCRRRSRRSRCDASRRIRPAVRQRQPKC